MSGDKEDSWIQIGPRSFLSGRPLSPGESYVYLEQEPIGVTITDMRDTLAEAKRFTRRDQSEAVRLVNKVRSALMSRAIGGTDSPFLWNRLMVNLAVGVDAILSDPEVFTGYIDGVRHELLSLKGD